MSWPQLFTSRELARRLLFHWISSEANKFPLIISARFLHREIIIIYDILLASFCIRFIRLSLRGRRQKGKGNRGEDRARA